MINRRLGSALLIALTTSVALASETAERPAAPAIEPRQLPAQVSIPNTRRIDFVSKVNGYRYTISVALPFEPAPAKGYGVLYVLDGYNFFASATEAVRLFNAPGVVVVGIGYPDDPTLVRSVMAKHAPIPEVSIFHNLPAFRVAPQLERFRDLSLPASNEDLERMASVLHGFPRLKSEDVGGLDDFLKMIEMEVKPKVAALTSIDSTRDALFGHSLAGLAALHALFVEPAAFRTFIIASPSIWWNKKEVLADGARFAAAVSSGRASPRVLVTVGGEESTLPKDLPAGWGDRASIVTELREARMVENGRELVAWLKSLHGEAGYLVEDYVAFDKQNHVSSPWSALARGIPYAFAPTS